MNFFLCKIKIKRGLVSTSMTKTMWKENYKEKNEQPTKKMGKKMPWNMFRWWTWQKKRMNRINYHRITITKVIARGENKSKNKNHRSSRHSTRRDTMRNTRAFSSLGCRSLPSESGATVFSSIFLFHLFTRRVIIFFQFHRIVCSWTNVVGLHLESAVYYCA